MADQYSTALFYDYQTRCEPVDDASGPFWCPCGFSCGCWCERGCDDRSLVLGTEIGLAIEDCEGVQIGVAF